MAQLVESLPSMQDIVGLNPAWGSLFLSWGKKKSCLHVFMQLLCFASMTVQYMYMCTFEVRWVFQVVNTIAVKPQVSYHKESI